jgi:hypothetical protein
MYKKNPHKNPTIFQVRLGDSYSTVYAGFYCIALGPRHFGSLAIHHSFLLFLIYGLINSFIQNPLIIKMTPPYTYFNHSLSMIYSRNYRKTILIYWDYFSMFKSFEILFITGFPTFKWRWNSKTSLGFQRQICIPYLGFGLTISIDEKRTLQRLTVHRSHDERQVDVLSTSKILYQTPNSQSRLNLEVQ